MHTHDGTQGVPAAEAARMLLDISVATIYRWRIDNEGYQKMYDSKRRQERPEWWEEKIVPKISKGAWLIPKTSEPPRVEAS